MKSKYNKKQPDYLLSNNVFGNSCCWIIRFIINIFEDIVYSSQDLLPKHSHNREQRTSICNFVLFYLTTVTGQYEYVTISDATLPSNIFLNPEFPLLPITIRSTSLSSA